MNIPIKIINLIGIRDPGILTDFPFNGISKSGFLFEVDYLTITKHFIPRQVLTTILVPTPPPGLITSFSNQTSSFGYLTIPLMAKVTFGKKIQIFCNAGIFAAFLTKQTDDVASWLKNNYEGPEVYDYKESSNNGIQNYRKMDAGLSCGAGIGVPIGKHLLISAECRYNYGLRNSWRPDYSKEQPFLAKGELLLRTIGGNIGIAYKFSARETDK